MESHIRLAVEQHSENIVANMYLFDFGADADFLSISLFLHWKQTFGEFQVGIHHAYEQHTASQISGEVSRIHDLGFAVIRVTLGYDPLNPESIRRTNAFYAATRSLNVEVALVIPNHESLNTIRYYLNQWGEDVAYIQIIKEPDASQSWAAGALFTDDEIFSKFEAVYNLGVTVSAAVAVVEAIALSLPFGYIARFSITK